MPAVTTNATLKKNAVKSTGAMPLTSALKTKESAVSQPKLMESTRNGTHLKTNTLAAMVNTISSTP